MATQRRSKLKSSAEQNRALRTQLEIEVFGAVRSPRVGLSEPEAWWRQHYDWLKHRGYLLRQRYSPDWKPSWVGTKRSKFASEDGRGARVRCLHVRVIEVLLIKR